VPGFLERSIVVRLRRAEALAKVGQALRAGSTQVLPAYGKDNRSASPAGASMRSGRALARTRGVTPDDGRWRMSSLRLPCKAVAALGARVWLRLSEAVQPLWEPL